MKIRDGFVSNSSSTSFVIRNMDITDEQRYSIINHQMAEGDTQWDVRQDLGFIIGSTSAHSYNMSAYLKKIGVNKDYILWVSS